MLKHGEIYIHIPFCIKKCDYCDFLSAPSDEGTMKKYKDALIKELSMSEEMLSSYVIDTVFIGGGTPTILKPGYIAEIMCALRSKAKLARGAEITIECNPGTITAEKMSEYKKAGINRLSIGLQSADNEELRRIGRIHTWEQFREGYGMARERGFENINIDIMSALPGQTMQSYKRTLNKVVELNPAHISAYSLIVEENTPMHDRVALAAKRGENILPDEDTEREMYYMTNDILSAAGYVRYEISNYSKKGYECRHNIGYWERKDYFGIGVGAASLVENIRYKNTVNTSEYIESLANMKDGELSRLRTDVEKLTAGDQMEEFMFLGLRMTKGVSTKKFCREFGRDYREVYGGVTRDLVKKGLLSEKGEYIALTKRGTDVSNSVMAEFLFI